MKKTIQYAYQYDDNLEKIYAGIRALISLAIVYCTIKWIDPATAFERSLTAFVSVVEFYILAYQIDNLRAKVIEDDTNG